MIVFVGDSRVLSIEKALSERERQELDPIFLYRNGARISTILEMLNEYKDQKRKIPVMITIVGLIGDVLLKKNGKEYPSITIREEVHNTKKEYPSLDGIVKMRTNVEEELECMWPGVAVVWVLPFPVDLGTFIKQQATQPVPKHVECAANRVTLEFNNYMSSVDRIFQKDTRDANVLPWFAFWRDVSNQRTDVPSEFVEFMGRIRRGLRVPSLCPEASLDGLHPQLRTSQGLLRAVVRKYRDILRRSSTPLLPEASVTLRRDQAEASVTLRKEQATLRKDQATQVDFKSFEPDWFVLPCKHHGSVVKEEEDKFLCKKCSRFFMKDALYVECNYLLYGLKASKPPASLSVDLISL